MSDTIVHHILTQRTARYYTLGKLDAGTKHIWLVLHGYGQLAEYFIRHFKNIRDDHHFFIAPEALSRYYLNENTGRIGATWMTKEDRENEISDYLTYLDSIMGSIQIPSGCSLHVLGFSQGAATACRWVFHSKIPVRSLICWAGFFPPDMQWESPKYTGNEMTTYLLYGNQDEYMNADIEKQIQKVFSALKKQPNIITFEGRHEIPATTLQTLVEQIEKT